MSWTDIEAKWTAMTRRVQSDRPSEDGGMMTSREPEQTSSLREEVTELRAPAPLDRPAT